MDMSISGVLHLTKAGLLPTRDGCYAINAYSDPFVE